MIRKAHILNIEKQNLYIKSCMIDEKREQSDYHCRPLQGSAWPSSTKFATQSFSAVLWVIKLHYQGLTGPFDPFLDLSSSCRNLNFRSKLEPFGTQKCPFGLWKAKMLKNWTNLRAVAGQNEKAKRVERCIANSKKLVPEAIIAAESLSLLPSLTLIVWKKDSIIWTKRESVCLEIDKLWSLWQWITSSNPKGQICVECIN